MSPDITGIAHRRPGSMSGSVSRYQDPDQDIKQNRVGRVQEQAHQVVTRRHQPEKAILRLQRASMTIG